MKLLDQRSYLFFRATNAGALNFVFSLKGDSLAINVIEIPADDFVNSGQTRAHSHKHAVGIPIRLFSQRTRKSRSIYHGNEFIIRGVDFPSDFKAGVEGLNRFRELVELGIHRLDALESTLISGFNFFLCLMMLEPYRAENSATCANNRAEKAHSNCWIKASKCKKSDCCESGSYEDQAEHLEGFRLDHGRNDMLRPINSSSLSLGLTTSTTNSIARVRGRARGGGYVCSAPAPTSCGERL